MIVNMYPYLVTNGNGQEAVRFYQESLGAELLNMKTFGDMPGNPEHPTPPEAKNRVLNAHLKVGDFDLMLSDTFPGMPYQVGNQITISIMIDDIGQAKEIFGKLESGGETLMPLQETFWSPQYGQVKDKYGVTWQVSVQQ